MSERKQVIAHGCRMGEPRWRHGEVQSEEHDGDEGLHQEQGSTIGAKGRFGPVYRGIGAVARGDKTKRGHGDQRKQDQTHPIANGHGAKYVRIGSQVQQQTASACVLIANSLPRSIPSDCRERLTHI